MIFPSPQFYESIDGTYKLKNIYDTADLYSMWLALKDGNSDISYRTDSGFSEDEYEIAIGEEGITITSSGDTGKFRAITTLRQLIDEGDEISCCKIKDFPSFRKRAYMLEVSVRIPCMATLKAFVDKLAELKYNEFQLYMEGMCYKFEAYSDLISHECLGPCEMDELDKYCRERFIELIPTLNGFGHMSDWLKTSRFSHLSVGPADWGTLDITNPEAYELVSNTYQSLLPHFRSEYVNIGLDEVGGLGKYQLEEICNERGKGNVYLDWLCTLSDLCRNEYNKKVMFWDDMLPGFSDESLNRIPEDATVMSWSYDVIQTQMWAEKVMKYSEKGLRFYMCCCNDTWNTFTGRSEIANFNLRSAGDIGVKYGAEGYMLTDWGNNGHPEFLPMSYNYCALGAQNAWNVEVEQNGGYNKNNFVYNARKYADRYMYKANLAKHVARLSDYYALEPERPFGVTCCFYSIICSMSEKQFEVWFNIDDFFDDIPFYFTNVKEYVEKIISDIEKESDGTITQREILIDAKFVLLGARLMLHRYNSNDKEEIQLSISMIDELSAEYRELWNSMYYEFGCNIFTEKLLERKKELLELLNK